MLGSAALFSRHRHESAHNRWAFGYTRQVTPGFGVSLQGPIKGAAIVRSATVAVVWQGFLWRDILLRCSDIVSQGGGVSVAITRVQDNAQWQASADALVEIDARFHAYVERFGPPRPRFARESAFVSLSRSVVFQQLHGAAASRIWQRVSEAVGTPFSSSAFLAISDQVLRCAGLSRNKIASLRDLASRVEAKTLRLQFPSRKSDEDIVRELTVVRGIGRWTAEMFLLFHLRRKDVWPVTDYGVRKGFARFAGFTEMPSPSALSDAANRYRPHRSALTWYLWQIASAIPASPVEG